MSAFQCRLQMGRPLTATVRIMLFTGAFFAISLFSQRVAQGESGLQHASKGQTIQVRQFAPLPAPFSAPRVRTPGPMQAALTFDDGPCNSRTRQTVNVLGDTVATFFVIGGQVRRSPSEAQYAASQGHSIQNHTMDHKRLNGLTADEIFSQLDVASNFIENTIGVRPTVEDAGRVLLETHIFDFNQAVYGKVIRVEFIEKLRDEAKYPDLASLQQAIHQDAQKAINYFKNASNV